MVRRVYGQPGQARHRAEVVEYRMEQHAAKLEAGWRPCGHLVLTPPLALRRRPLE
jgi:hypothetical protein